MMRLDDTRTDNIKLTDQHAWHVSIMDSQACISGLSLTSVMSAQVMLALKHNRNVP